MTEKTKISIIVPCYNEEPILKDNIAKIKQIMDITLWDYEIILIDDTSKDKTVEVARQIVANNNRCRLICHEKNLGRGGTVSEGIKIAKGDIAGFIDIDLETPAHYILPLINEVIHGADIAAAERVYKFILKDFSVMHRWIAHKAYKLIVKLTLKTKLKDTETGCKFFRREKILPVLDEIKDTRWFWDTEIMVRSYYKGLKIKEIPSLFIRKKEVASSLNFVSDTIDYFKSIVKLRKELKTKKII